MRGGKKIERWDDGCGGGGGGLGGGCGGRNGEWLMVIQSGSVCGVATSVDTSGLGDAAVGIADVATGDCVTHEVR